MAKFWKAEFWTNRLRRHGESLKLAGDKLGEYAKAAWNGGLKDFIKGLADEAADTIEDNKALIFAAVAQIATGKGMQDGESKQDAFFRMLEPILSTLQGDAIDRIRGAAVGYFRSLADTDEEAAAILEEMLDELD